MKKKIHLKKFDSSQCLIDMGLRWIYASLSTQMKNINDKFIYENIKKTQITTSIEWNIKKKIRQLHSLAMENLKIELAPPFSVVMQYNCNLYVIY
jgi:hypothetical protein